MRVICCTDAKYIQIKRGRKKEYVAPVVAPPVVAQKKAPVPAAKEYTAPAVVQLKAPVTNGRHLLKRIVIRPIRWRGAAKEYVAPTLAPPAVVEKKKAPVPEAKTYTAPVKIEKRRALVP
jgi:hypothetical protein